MKCGVALPNGVPGATVDQLQDFARRAEARRFSSLGAIDRLVYQCYQPLAALTTAAAVTESIELCTSVLLGPLWGNAAVLASQAASLQAISAGRFSLGIGLGDRVDDFELSGTDRATRGARMDLMLDQLLSIWSAGEVGPRIAARPRLIVGGLVEASFARTARFADGWIGGGTPPAGYAEMAAKVDREWSRANRADRPHKMNCIYFSLGSDGEENAGTYLGNYYAHLGEETAAMIVRSAAKDAEAVARSLAAYEDAGCDEIIMLPCSSDPAQVDFLADAAGL